MTIIGEIRLNVPDDDWVDQAVCPQTDAEEFFPEKGSSAAVAKAVCRGCPVRIKCLDWALANNETWGVWGGFTPKERDRLLKGHNPMRGPGRPTGTAHRPNGHGIACRCVVCRRPA